MKIIINDILQRIKNIRFYILLILPTVVITYFFSVNRPYWDDYDAVLKFLSNVKDSNFDFIKLCSLCFEQHMEHRIFFTKIMILLQYLVTGEANFIILSFIGIFFWLLLVVLLYKWLQIDKSSWKVQGLFIIFTNIICYYELVSWSMASIQNFSSLLFIFLSVFCAYSGRKKLSVVTLIIALLCGPNAFVLFPVLWFISYKDKDKIYFLSTVFVSVIYLPLYFHGYINPPNHISAFTVITNPLRTISFYFVFLGSLLRKQTISMILGILFLCFGLKRFYSKQDIIGSLFIIIFLTAGMVTIGRSGFGVGSALASRYGEYSLLMFLLIIGAYREKIDQWNVWKSAVIISICFIYMVFADVHYMYKKNIKRKNSIINSIVYPDNDTAVGILKRAELLGIYPASKYYEDQLSPKK